MGLFAWLKESFAAQKYIFRAMSEMDRQNAAYASMTTAELAQLSDDDLISAALYRTDKKINSLLGKKKKGKPAEWAELLSGAQRTVYIISYFESDLQSGGLEYFLVRNGAFAPIVSRCLEEVGAEAHRALYDDFFSTYGSKLSHAAILEYHEEIVLFDRAYSELPPIEPIISPYLRAHLEEF